VLFRLSDREGLAFFPSPPLTILISIDNDFLMRAAYTAGINTRTGNMEVAYVKPDPLGTHS
jgi:hypothetical protein